MAKQYKVKLVRKEKIAKDTWLFAFSAKGRSSSGREEPITFIPGQYMTYTLPLPNGKTDWRDMTIASSPIQKELWLVTKIHQTPSLWKQTLFALRIGQTIALEGPNGGFTLRDKKKPYVFLAGGIGVTVFHSILKGLAENSQDTPMTLLASFRKKEDIIFQEELKNTENENRKVIYTLTQENWEEETGRISEKLIKKYVKEINNSIFMIAGGQGFVDSMNDLLIEIGVPLENIRIDYFTGY